MNNKSRSIFVFSNLLLCFKKLNTQRLYIVPLLFVLIVVFLLPNTVFANELSSHEIIEMSNKERLKNNVQTLNLNSKLTIAANEKANYILQSQTFAHDIDNKRFSKWIKDADYEYSYVGENLAIDFEKTDQVIKAWLNSPSHHDNLLNPIHEEIGVAVVEGEFNGEKTVVIVQIMGRSLEKTIPFKDKNSKKVQSLGTEIISPDWNIDKKIKNDFYIIKNNIKRNISKEKIKDFDNLISNQYYLYLGLILIYFYFLIIGYYVKNKSIKNKFILNLNLRKEKNHYK